MKPLVTCAALIFGAISLHAQVLLDIQITSPGTMVITSTGLGPVTDNGTQTFVDGIDLLGLFTPSDEVGSVQAEDGSTLTTGDSSTGPVLFLAATDSWSEENADLNLYAEGDGALSPETFTYGMPAFAVGTSITVNYTGLVFSGIDYGVVLAGYTGSNSLPNTEVSFAAVNGGSNASPIGVYHVTSATPEPSTYALMLGSLAMLAFCLRRKLA